MRKASTGDGWPDRRHPVTVPSPPSASDRIDGQVSATRKHGQTMSETFKYLAIKNWAKYQPDKKLRNKGASLPWVKDYTDKEFDADYCQLAPTERYVLDAMCRLTGRIGHNVPMNNQFIVSALAIPPRQRGNVQAAVKQLTSLGFLIPTNQEDRFSTGEKTCGEGEGRVATPQTEGEKDKPKEGMKEGRKEAPVATLPTPGVPSESLNPSDQELSQASDMYDLWFKKTTVGFLESGDGAWSDMNTAIGLIRTHGWEEVWSVFTGTWECPKTAGIRYHYDEKNDKSGFTFWAEKYELTRSTIQTWRNKLGAVKAAKAEVGAA